MALTHSISGIRQYQSKYLLDIAVTDTVTGRIYNPQFSLDSSPDSAEQESWATVAKNRVQAELDYEANDMNLTTDEDRLLEYYRGIKRDVILRIRAFPGVTPQQAKDYIATEYPDSPFDFDQLYAIWIEMIKVSTWVQFKTWVIGNKFRGID